MIGWGLLVPSFLLGVGIAITAGAGARTNSRGLPGETGTQLVLVELFTSQGCSSCPPADRLLRDVGERSDVIALAYHVDYWDHLGWKDPFSSARWSDRQRRYAAWLGEDTIYTPQLVINGRNHVVGSDRVAIEQELTQPGPWRLADRPTLHVIARHRADRIDVQVHVRDGPRTGSRVRIALFERNLEVPISRGENSGRTLAYDYVVRDMRDSDPSQSAGSRASFEIEPGWKSADLGVVAFLQDEATGTVHAVTRAGAPSSTRP